MDHTTEIALVGALLFGAGMRFLVAHTTDRRVIQSAQGWDQRRWWQPRPTPKDHSVLERLREPGRQKRASDEEEQRELLEQLAHVPHQEVAEFLHRLELLESVAGHGIWVRRHLG